MALEGLTE